MPRGPRLPVFLHEPLSRRLGPEMNLWIAMGSAFHRSHGGCVGVSASRIQAGDGVVIAEEI